MSDAKGRNHELDQIAKPVGQFGFEASTLPAELAQDHVSVAGSSDGKVRSKWRIAAILTALYLSLFIAALDATIIATAIASITADLNSASGYVWIGGAYLLGNASAAPIWAKMSDIWGRKLILLAAVALFFVSSIVCALAIDMKMLIVGRAGQGVAGGGLMLLVNICISDLFSMRRRSLFLGLCEGIWALAGGVGPVLGGTFASLLTWRWCFWINLPCAGLAFVLLLLFLDVQHESTSFLEGIKAIDWAGIVSFLGVVLMILLGLDFGGETFPWKSPTVISLIVVGGLLIVVFIYSEKKLARFPLIPLGLFQDRSNLGCMLITFCHGFVFIAAEYYLPLYFQSAKAASPLRSGILLLPLIVVTASFGVISGLIIHGTGHYVELMWVGAVFLTIGNGLFITFKPDSSIGQIIGFEIIAGIGSGCLFQAPLIALQATVPQSDIATATSTQTFIRNMALSFSIIIGGVVFQNSMISEASSLRMAGLPQAVTDKLSKAAAANVMIAQTLSDPARQTLVKQAFALSMRNMWIMYTVVGFIGVFVSLMIRKNHLSHEHSETVTGLKKESVSK